MEYTKGDWKASQMSRDNSSWLIEDEEGKQTCGIWAGQTVSPSFSNATNEANAHLVAAAPQLHRELKEADRVICELCKRLNPQHRGCFICADRESRLIALEKVEGK